MYRAISVSGEFVKLFVKYCTLNQFNLFVSVFCSDHAFEAVKINSKPTMTTNRWKTCICTFLYYYMKLMDKLHLFDKCVGYKNSHC